MDGYIEFANNSWAKNHGYKLDELTGKHLSIFHTEEQLENQVIPFNEILMEKGGNQGEVDHKRKDGSKILGKNHRTARIKILYIQANQPFQ